MHEIWNPWHGCTKCSEGCRTCGSRLICNGCSDCGKCGDAPARGGSAR